MYLNIVSCLVVVAALSSNVEAMSEDDMQAIKATWMGYLKDCSKEYEVNMDQWKVAAKSKNMDGVNSCALACMFKKAGYMNDQGLFDSDYAKEQGLQYVTTEEEKERFLAANEDCESVNKENVSDGAKGCEVAALLTKCIMKYMPQ